MTPILTIFAAVACQEPNAGCSRGELKPTKATGWINKDVVIVAVRSADLTAKSFASRIHAVRDGN